MKKLTWPLRRWLIQLLAADDVIVLNSNFRLSKGITVVGDDPGRGIWISGNTITP